MSGEADRNAPIRGGRNDAGGKRIAPIEKLTGFLSFQAFGRQEGVVGEDVEVAIAIPPGVSDNKLGGTRAMQVKRVLKPAAVAPTAALKLARFGVLSHKAVFHFRLLFSNGDGIERSGLPSSSRAPAS
jgi:hypothetical protein